MDGLATLVERDDEIGQRARELLLGTHGIHSRYVEVDGRVHGFLHRDPIVDPAAQNGLLKVARWLLDDRLEGSPDVPDWDSLDLAGLCALRSAVVREEVIPCLIEILRETGKPQVLRMLCHLGVDDEFVRRRYLESLRGWNAAEASKLDLLPCWKHHDDETLAAFDRVFSAAADKYELVDRLDFAGLLDSSEHDIVRRFFEEMEEKPGEYWYGLRGRGFRHVAIPSPDETKITQVNKLGLTIATLQARGEDCSEPADALAAILQGGYDLSGGGGGRDYYQSAFWHAEALGLRGPEFVEAALLVLESERPLLNHLQFAQELLQEAELTRAQEERLAALPPMCGGPWPEGLHRIPYLRRELYRGKTRWLEDLCAATPLIARDAEYLLVFLDRGELYQRRHTLELVRDYRLDSPAIRAAVEDRTRDCDRLVRELAAAIVAERGW